MNSINNAGGIENYVNSNENSWEIIGKLANTGTLPRLYFACGKDDFLYDTYAAFKQYAREIGLNAKFEEIEGFKHEWRFWDITIQHALEFFELDAQDMGNPF